MQAKREFTRDEADDIARQLGIDFVVEGFELDEFRKGLNVELEHGSVHPETDITHDDPLMTGRLALAHLRERPDFYSFLLAVEGNLEEP
jgi:hypothetical protein